MTRMSMTMTSKMSLTKTKASMTRTIKRSLTMTTHHSNCPAFL